MTRFGQTRGVGDSKGDSVRLDASQRLEPPMSRGQKRAVAVLEVIMAIRKRRHSWRSNTVTSAIWLLVWVLTLPFAYALVVVRNWHKP